jgi:hypothetical protein
MSTTRKIGATFATLMAFAAFAAFVTVGTLALPTDSQAPDSNTFRTDTVDISTTPTSALVSFSSMAPGDSVTDHIVVTNGGTLAQRYSVSSTATNTDAKGLKDQLTLTVKTVDATTPASPCDNFDGTQLYAGDLDSTAGKIVGDSTTGARNLAASANETLCFKVELPTSTGNAFQNATTTATLTFDHEPIANN